MSRFFVFYMAACVILFLSMTGLFQAIGLHETFMEESSGSHASDDGQSTEEAPPFTKEEFMEEYTKYYGSDRTLNFEPAPLIGKQYYRVEQSVPIYSDAEDTEAYSEVFPANGVFELIESKKNILGGEWIHQIKVSDGKRNYIMYMFHKDLGAWTYYGQSPSVDQMLRHHQGMLNYQAKRDERAAIVEANYQEALAAWREAEALRKNRNPLRNGIISLQENAARFNPSGFVFNALIAGGITLVTAFFLGAIGWLRSTRAWEADFGFDDINPEDPYGEESGKSGPPPQRPPGPPSPPGHPQNGNGV